jgi:hypothetical protein
MANNHPLHLLRKALLITAVLGMILSSCKPQSAEEPRLRITNNGSVPINNLVVRFPQDRIEFGDVPAGTSTEYLDVPNGVFAYAAYEFEVDGEVITQPVIDWIGESPLSGILFTYTIDFDPARENTGDMIRLMEVKNDD